MKKQIRNLAQFKKAARAFALGLKPHPDRAEVVGLYGDLGSGKTTFVQNAAKALGVSDVVTSPTFLIMRKFPIRHSGFKTLIHLDAYRLKSGDDLLALGVAELLKNPDNLIFVEWADRVAGILPKKHIKLYFEHAGKTARKVSL